jgi:hypothetical protein
MADALAARRELLTRDVLPKLTEPIREAPQAQRGCAVDRICGDRSAFCGT